MDNKDCGCPITTGGQVHGLECRFSRTGASTSSLACVHPYARIRQALICMDCGTEVGLAHIIGNPVECVTSSSYYLTEWNSTLEHAIRFNPEHTCRSDRCSHPYVGTGK